MFDLYNTKDESNSSIWFDMPYCRPDTMMFTQK